ncbi:MAG TPA: hypothetical protein VFW52_00880 [Candidatus Saccharimonadales bacterium]|nr:hypothetical protein [Candidatus Saccharimonadales bacterium]
MKFSVKQLRFLLLGLLGLCALAFVAITIFGLKALSSKSAELADLKLKNETADAQLTSLGVAKKEVEQYSYFNDVAKSVLPSDKDQAKAVLTIFKLAQEAGISIASITFPTSNLGGTGTSKATGSSSAAISQAQPVSGIKGLYSLQLTITPEANSALPDDKVTTYAKFKDFLQRIERDRRTAQITQVSIQPEQIGNKPGDLINFSLTVNIFMRPDK